jgi:hypothetical protein
MFFAEENRDPGVLVYSGISMHRDFNRGRLPAEIAMGGQRLADFSRHGPREPLEIAGVGFFFLHVRCEITVILPEGQLSFEAKT